MNHYLKYSLSLLLLFSVFFSCKNSEKKTVDNISDEKITQTEAIYSLNIPGTNIGWVAYKFTEKVGVSGRFDEFKLTPKSKSGSIDAILLGSKMSIDAMSVNSSNEIRDEKLKESFFKIFNTDTIHGEILEASKNIGTLALEMNNLTKNIPFKYSVKTDTIFMKATINLVEWKGEDAVNALNKVCFDLHKGADGISKLWPDVDIVVALPVTEK